MASKFISFEDMESYPEGTDFWDHNPDYYVVKETEGGVVLFETTEEASRRPLNKGILGPAEIRNTRSYDWRTKMTQKDFTTFEMEQRVKNIDDKRKQEIMRDAALDMYEALEEIAGYYKSCENSEQDFSLSHDGMIDIARAAIAKARGESC